ncbi:MAG: phosphatase PAP2 family protein [Bacteroidaceae bacterium]|nr:phosphatase PAP2 family protein [Bacteroidaceae bacterium]
MKIKVLALLVLCLLNVEMKALGVTHSNDSLLHRKENTYLSPFVGGSLVLVGSLLTFDHGGSTLGMAFEPSFKCKADEYLRFAPGVALVGMKAFGVESRTEKWSELVVRSAASMTIMGLTVEGTKRLAGRVRPDGSDDRSFPSGHSATAFLTASLFAKEYGHLSPWYSVGAYGVATSTALLRRMGDHHWTGDVMVGAGLGILSTELAYALADMFYGKNKPRMNSHQSLNEGTSSMAWMYMHYLLPHSISGEVSGRKVRSRVGYGVGMEVSHYLTPHVGVSGRIGLTTSQMEVACEGTRGTEWLVSERPFDHVSLAIGPCLSLPLGRYFSVGTRVRGGYGFYPQTYLAEQRIEASQGWGFDGGVSVDYLTSQGVSLRMSADYNSWSSITEGIENRGLSFGLSAGWGW